MYGLDEARLHREAEKPMPENLDEWTDICAPYDRAVFETMDTTVSFSFAGEQSLTLLLGSSMSGTLVSHAEEMTNPGESLISDNEALPYGVVLRLAAVDPQGTVREYRTEVYLLSEDLSAHRPGCLNVSLAADPADLVDYEQGILVKGAV